MVPKSRLALIGLFVLSIVAVAWLARPRNDQVPAKLPANVVAAGHTPSQVPAAGGSGSASAPAPGAAAVATARAALVFGEHGPVTLADIPEGSFRRALLRLQGGIQAQVLEQLGRMRVPVNNLASLHVDRTGHLFYTCLPPTEAQLASLARKRAAASAPKVPQAAAVPVSSPPVRHSRSGASKVIYLDFNGHTVTGTHWNEGNGQVGDADYEAPVATYQAQAYDTDSDPANFSDVEQAAIIEIWARVAEDYAPFDVDVTTEQPADFTANTGRILITKSKDANNVDLPSSSAGGIAYVDVFGFSNYAQYSPAFVYYESLGNDVDAIADAASHEMGHNLGLEHDGTASEEYYEGHSGGGVPSWGPIMGAPYDMDLTQWSKGEYTNANNTQDDLAIIAVKLAYRPDDGQDSNGAATALNASGGSLSGAGLIGATGDADRFSFTGSGQVSFEVAGKPVPNSASGTNLDVALELYDGAGNAIASTDSAGTSSQTLNATIVSGTYYLRVRGVGAGAPLGTPPTGYTSYGSLGAYTITGTITASGAPLFTQQPTVASVNAGQPAGFTAQTTNATSYRWQRFPAGGGGWEDLADDADYSGTASTSLAIASATLAMSGDQFRLVATNASGSTPSNPATLTVNSVESPQFIQQPASVAVVLGQTAMFGAQVSGATSYRWQRLLANGGAWTDLSDGGPYGGTTTTSLSVAGVTVTMLGDQFRLVATNSHGSTTSNPATLSSSTPIAPTIVRDPFTFMTYAGYPLSFDVVVAGSAPLSYGWQRKTAGSATWNNLADGPDFSGTNTSRLTVTSATLAMNGDSFRVVVTNAAGSVTSAAASMTVLPSESPAIVGLPEYLNVEYGETLEIGAGISGTAPIALQWYFNDTAIEGATGTSISRPNSTQAYSGTYTLTATNAVGSVSRSVQVTVADLVPVTIVRQPASVDAIQGGSANFTLEVNGSAPITYQWFHNGSPIQYATFGAVTVSVNAASVGEYTVQVTNPAGTITSAPATLVMIPRPAPAAFAIEGKLTLPVGARLDLSGISSASGNATIQWYKNGVAIPGAVNTGYFKDSIGFEDEGAYSFSITDLYGTAYSADALVTVLGGTRPWNYFGRQGNIAYFLDQTSPRILRYQLSTESWLPPTVLTAGKTPTAMLPTAEGVFIAYGTEVVRRSLDLQTETPVATSTSNVDRFLAATDYIYFRDGGGTVRAYDRATLAAGPDSAFYGIDDLLATPRAAYSATSHRFFACMSGSTRLLSFPVSDTGVIGSASSQALNGDFQFGSELTLLPDESGLFVSSGIVFANPGLDYLGTLTTAYDDIARLPGGDVVALRGKKLSRYGGPGFSPRGEAALASPGVTLYEYGGKLFVFSAPVPGTGTPGVEKVSAASLVEPVTADRGSPLRRWISVDGVFLDANKNINVVSRSERGVVRWNPFSRQFQPTLPLRAAPMFCSYAPTVDRLALSYSDGRVSDLFPSSDPVEQAFGGMPERNRKSALVAMDDLLVLDFQSFSTGASGKLVLDDLGTAVYYSGAGSWDQSVGWVTAGRRLLSADSINGVLSSEEVSLAGGLSQDSTSGSGIDAPVYPNREGNLILSANGRIFDAGLKPVGALGNHVADGLWTTGGLYTLRIRPDGTRLQKWSLSNLSLVSQIDLEGTPQRVFQVDNSTLVIVTTVEGYLTFHLVSDGLAKIATISNHPSFPPDRPTLFDGNAYLSNNPDIAAGIGDAPDKLDQAWTHYWKYGIGEGRTDGDFNVQAYLAQYPDLKAQFGDDLRAAALHWYTIGRKDGLRIPAGFDVNGYFARNQDIAGAFANDKYGAWLHYYNYGVFEGRSFDANFIPAEYLELNQDLKRAGGGDLKGAVMHWLSYGHPVEDRMGRVPIGFNVDNYLARYPDLAAGFANITPVAVRNVAVWQHFLDYGAAEGRSDGDFDIYSYLAGNPDVAVAVNNNPRSAALHWFFYGRREGRRIPGGFNVQNYRTLYPDLVVFGGDDLYGSWIHYRDVGVLEGRYYDDTFRPADYLALNPDIAAVIGNNYRDALLHWLYYGQYEGRSAKF